MYKNSILEIKKHGKWLFLCNFVGKTIGNMEYTKFQRILIYRERQKFDEFIQHSELTEIIIDNMQNIGVLMIDNFEQRALTCLNTAYYICTLMMLEDKPSWRWPEYREYAFCNEPYHKETYQAITLSVVAILLKHYNEQWRKENEKFINRIEEFVKESKNVYIQLGLSSSNIVTERYDIIYNTLESGIYNDLMIPDDTFAPRDLRDEEICGTVLGEGIEYVTDNIKKLQGRDLQLETIASVRDRIKKSLSDLKKVEGRPFVDNIGLQGKIYQLKKAIDTLTKIEDDVRNSPADGLSAPNQNTTLRVKVGCREREFAKENSQLRQQIDELSKQNKKNTEIIDSLRNDLEAEKLNRQSSEKKSKKLQKELNKAKKQLAAILVENDEESDHSVDKSSYTFTNNIRYELYLRLLENSGCEAGIQTNQTTIGDLWEALTEKSGEKCRQYISTRQYQTKVTMKHIPKINALLKSMGIDIEL